MNTENRMQKTQEGADAVYPRNLDPGEVPDRNARLNDVMRSSVAISNVWFDIKDIFKSNDWIHHLRLTFMEISESGKPSEIVLSSLATPTEDVSAYPDWLRDLPSTKDGRLVPIEFHEGLDLSDGYRILLSGAPKVYRALKRYSDSGRIVRSYVIEIGRAQVDRLRTHRAGAHGFLELCCPSMLLGFKSAVRLDEPRIDQPKGQS